MRKKIGVDTFLLSTILTLALAGLFVFSSASLGLLLRAETPYTFIVGKQVALIIAGLILGLGVVARIPYRLWQRAALPIFLAGLVLCALVFVPAIGFSSGGASRWIHVGSTTFQPSELLKLGFVLVLASYYSRPRVRASEWVSGYLPFLGLMSIVALLLLAQPDTGTFMVFAATGLALFLAAGGNLRAVGLSFLLGLLILALLAAARPYVRERIMTFVDPSRDAQGSSYQLQQSLIAIGSGGVAGRGFGQSVQKFNYLPEPIGDSIFAVAGEEFGLIGTTLIVLLFTVFALRGYKLALSATSEFGQLVTVGIVTLIAAQSFLNIAAMTGLAPLTGVPLLFISHGGSSLLFAFIEVGIVLNVSKNQRA